MSNELLAVRLLEPYGEKAPGELVLVDRLRAKRLEQDGVGSIEPPETEGYADFGEGTQAVLHGREAVKAYDRPTSDKMVRKAPRRKG